MEELNISADIEIQPEEQATTVPLSGDAVTGDTVEIKQDGNISETNITIEQKAEALVKECLNLNQTGNITQEGDINLTLNQIGKSILKEGSSVSQSGKVIDKSRTVNLGSTFTETNAETPPPTLNFQCSINEGGGVEGVSIGGAIRSESNIDITLEANPITQQGVDIVNNVGVREVSRLSTLAFGAKATSHQGADITNNVDIREGRLVQLAQRSTIRNIPDIHVNQRGFVNPEENGDNVSVSAQINKGSDVLIATTAIEGDEALNVTPVIKGRARNVPDVFVDQRGFAITQEPGDAPTIIAQVGGGSDTLIAATVLEGKTPVEINHMLKGSVGEIGATMTPIHNMSADIIESIAPEIYAQINEGNTIPFVLEGKSTVDDRVIQEIFIDHVLNGSITELTKEEQIVNIVMAMNSAIHEHEFNLEMQNLPQISVFELIDGPSLSMGGRVRPVDVDIDINNIVEVAMQEPFFAQKLTAITNQMGDFAMKGEAVEGKNAATLSGRAIQSATQVGSVDIIVPITVIGGNHIDNFHIAGIAEQFNYSVENFLGITEAKAFSIPFDVNANVQEGADTNVVLSADVDSVGFSIKAEIYDEDNVVYQVTNIDKGLRDDRITIFPNQWTLAYINKPLAADGRPNRVSNFIVAKLIEQHGVDKLAEISLITSKHPISGEELSYVVQDGYVTPAGSINDFELAYHRDGAFYPVPFMIKSNSSEEIILNIE